jgi:hypothetical protein
MKFAGVVIAFALLFFPQEGNNLDVITLNRMPCPLEGTARSEDIRDLNQNKSRYHFPVASDIDPTVTLTSMIAPGDDEDRFDVKSAATVVGFVLEVQRGGIETCNCGATKPDERDTHIALTLSSMLPTDPDAKKQSVVAEVSPRTRILQKQKTGQNNWTTEALRGSIQGKWVEITGWLLFDFEHSHEAENTNPGNPSNWRATRWEIHPVMSIKVLDGPPGGAFQLAPSVITAFQRSHAAHVDSVPGRRQFVNRRNAKLRSRFAEDEHDEGNH